MAYNKQFLLLLLPNKKNKIAKKSYFQQQQKMRIRLNFPHASQFARSMPEEVDHIMSEVDYFMSDNIMSDDDDDVPDLEEVGPIILEVWNNNPRRLPPVGIPRLPVVIPRLPSIDIRHLFLTQIRPIFNDMYIQFDRCILGNKFQIFVTENKLSSTFTLAVTAKSGKINSDGLVDTGYITHRQGNYI